MNTAWNGSDEHGDYELWDDQTGNCVGAFGSLAEALRDVHAAVLMYGDDSPAVRSLTLIRLDGPGDGPLFAGDELIAQARRVTTGAAGAAGKSVPGTRAPL